MFLQLGGGLEPLLRHRRRRMLDSHRRRLERERLRLGKRVVLTGVLGVVFGGGRVFALFGGVEVVVGVVDGSAEGGAHGGFGEAWSVGGGLRAQLGEVEVGAGFVADVHGFVEAAFGPVSVEDDGVDGYCEDFDDDFDDGADEGPVLDGSVSYGGVVDIEG